MTRVLAIDTATPTAHVALLEATDAGIDTVAQTAADMKGSHAEHLFRLIDHVLAAAGWSKQQIDAFAVVRGPGSFTGVRIALGTAQGLALAADRPCVGVNTLEAMAEASGRCPGDRVPALGAGRGDLYIARYDASSSPPDQREAPGLQPAGSFWEAPPGFVLWGPGAEPPQDFQAAGGRRSATETAAAAGRIAILRGLDAAPEGPVSPLYIRPPDARLRSSR
ncbi:MAG: tRNA (adenosine(37)-N6)-threonylcarbamoyltransferase complex dimerization subunit type 1 TsaB [Acidobacteria bacterium]|nr:tRNA (adenosine(37)-N6)-threonylcarbamoyltransferase complex dimerization subunit type 1 TsaB [Acidobacteriota bacterium]NIM64238.1 tRNA (adenosine(37)-N6)-threonylcarbamoyltransferase complex dimerization subunit type 1 TsaB [Acidobacteriota bacterium]NIO59236.1 tRNA (adenosine(37)-N6)-threonylcarbamoyltransferase complex dimerization subunit type 1 TsaB [Acidobacteriota bacterium]NIQ30263.1 tRNA (adenosine(37)-N6)-threonylcarbamoyltransferase complex dimerization subunit type 1 TsaB [Acidob